MDFTTDKTTLTEGDIIELRWDCGEGTDTILTIDNGYRKSDIPLGSVGTRKFRLNRSKGRTRLTLRTKENGKERVKEIKVRVRKLKPVKAETVYENGRSGRGEDLRQKLSQWRQRFKTGFRALPVQKQMAYKILGLMAAGLVISAIWPRLYGAGMMLVLFYLGLTILKR